MKKISITHGNHLQSLFDPHGPRGLHLNNLSDGIRVFGGEVMGRFTSSKRRGSGYIISILNPGDEITLHTILWMNPKKQNWELQTTYPYIHSGTQVDIKLEAIHEDHNGLEAVLECEFLNGTFFVFDTRYYQNKDTYKIGETYTFTLAACIYPLYNVKTTQFEINWTEEVRIAMDQPLEYDEDGKLKPIIVHTENMRTILPSEDFYGDHEFQAPVETIEVLEWEDETVYKIGFSITRGTDSEDREVPLYGYIRKSLCEGIKLDIGTPITGICFLQGQLTDVDRK